MAQAFQNLFGYLLAQYLILELHADRAYARLWVLLTKVGLAVVVVIVGMWAVNAYLDMSRLNLLVFFGGTPVVLFLAFAPRVQAIGLVTAILGKKLGGATLPDSIKNGVGSWYSLIRATVMWFWVVSGFLSTMPFGNSPSAFWVVAAMLLTVAVVISHYNIGGKWLPYLLITYAIGVALMAFWELAPAEWREWRASSTASTSPSEVLRKEWTMKKDEVVFVPKKGRNCLTPSKRGKGERVVEDVGNSVKITAKEATNFVTWQYRATDVEHCNIALEELEARGKIH